MPAVSEYKGINHNFFISGSEIILDISIKISTQTADFALECRSEFYHEGCLFIPNDNKAILRFNDEI